MRDARNAIHVCLTAILAWLSCALEMPGNTLANPAFRQFAAIANEQQWAYAFGLCAACGVLGVATDRQWLRMASVFVLSTMHGIIAYCFYLSLQPGEPITTGIGTYAIIAALGYYLLWRRFVATTSVIRNYP